MYIHSCYKLLFLFLIARKKMGKIRFLEEVARD
jgi:hypothetical protein